MKARTTRTPLIKSTSGWLLLGLGFAIDRTTAFAPYCSAVVPSQQLLRLYAEEKSSSVPSSDKSWYDPEDEVKRRLARAKEILEKSKAKLESNESENSGLESAKNSNKKSRTKATGEPLPFFASKKVASDPNRRDKVIKAKDETTGLVQADGEKMAALSEEEEWELKSLLEVFENEMDENEDVYSLASQQLAERDVVQSIWNLRKQMQTEDYLKIFDKRNRFIGEDN